MARVSKVQDGGIILCDEWKLWPMDDRNWELCELRDGVWRPCGRYYSYNTVGEAIAYVVDVELKRKATDTAMDLMAALAEWRAVMDGIAETLR